MVEERKMSGVGLEIRSQSRTRNNTNLVVLVVNAGDISANAVNAGDISANTTNLVVLVPMQET